MFCLLASPLTSKPTAQMAVDLMILPYAPATTSVGPNFNPAQFGSLPEGLRGMGTHVVYLAPNGDMFNLAGPGKGRQGVRLARAMQGDQQWPFRQVTTTSPYMMGAVINRQEIPPRKYTVNVIIGSHAPHMTEYQYRMAEARWWAGQDETQDGWLGEYTRFSGWRWNPVRPDTQSGTVTTMDPTAFGNNASSWDLTWIATRPYFTKPALYRTWEAAYSGAPTVPPETLVGSTWLDKLVAKKYYWGLLPLANSGDLPSYAQFFVSSPGQAVLQDNDSTRLLPMPETTESVGTYMVDSEPGKRTLTASNDPRDNLVFDFIRQSRILNFFLSGVANEGIPLQMTWGERFMYAIPPKTVVQLMVGHSNPEGVITAVVPQRFKRAR